MFGKKKNGDRKSKAPKSTGSKNGLRFEYDDVRWTIDVDGEVTGMLVTGDRADEAAARIITALKTTGWKTIMLDAVGSGMTSSTIVDEKATDREEALEALKGVSSDTLAVLGGIMGKAAGGTEARGAGGPLLVLNGFYPKADAGDEAAKVDDEAVSEITSESRRALAGVLGEEKAAAVDEVLDSRKDLSEEGKAAGRHAIAAALAAVDHGPATDAPAIGDGATRAAVSAVLAHYTDGDLRAWVMKLPRTVLVLQAAISLMLTTIDDGLDLDLPGRGSGRLLTQCLTVLANMLREAESTEDDEVYDLVSTIMRLAKDTGLRTLVVSPKPEFKDLHPLLREVQARVIAGDLDPLDQWVAGSSDDSNVDYGVGDLTIVSPANYGLLNMSRGTTRSAKMPLDRTTITVV